MNVEMILAGTKLVGMVLSFALLLRARKRSVGLWSTSHCYHRLPDKSDVD